jgi:hypothetical protein
MPRGGYRGGGRPSAFQHGPTQTIRVPIVLASEILEFAQKLDREQLLVIDTIPKKDRIAMILKQALTLKPNAGGAIKTEIRKALELL